LPTRIDTTAREKTIKSRNWGSNKVTEKTTLVVARLQSVNELVLLVVIWEGVQRLFLTLSREMSVVCRLVVEERRHGARR
jgi:hypothetical protein